ncbi:MAG: hypothetical protein ABW000_07230 [Actinoplanes sp.]
MTDPIPGMPRPRSKPVRPSDDQIRRSRELSEWHREWVAKWAGRAGFHPREHPKPDSDYNLHHVLLDAPQEALDEFYHRVNEIMGVNPDR